MRFSSFAVESGGVSAPGGQGPEVRVWGESDVLVVSAPLPGVLRVRLFPEARANALGFPRMPVKRSFALRPDLPGGVTLNAAELDDDLLVIGGGLSLRLDRLSGAWRVSTGSGSTERVLVSALGWSGEAPTQRPALDAERFNLRRTRLNLDAPDGAMYLGFGERVGPLDKRGMHLTFWNTDCYPHHTETDPLYVSVPFTTVLQDGRAHGVFVDESWRMEVDVARAHPHELRWASSGPELDVYVLAGPRPADVLRRYADLTGYAPMPPLWALGAAQSRWGYRTADDLRAVIQGYRDRKLPLDSVYVDIDYMDAYKVWTVSGANFPDLRAFVKEASAQGVKLVPIVDPGVKLEAGYDVYEEALKGDHLVHTARGDVLVGEVWPDPAVFPDFTRPEVVAWWAGRHKVFADAGIQGQWNDMNEPACFSLRQPRETEGKTLPYDARHGTRTHLEVHNAYANGMSEASRLGYAKFNPQIRPWVLTRAGYAGIQRHATVWTGDNTATWSHLALSLPMIQGLGLSGIPFAAADVGGFAGDTTGELLARWYQAAVGYAFVRNHAALGTADQEPWRFGETVTDVIRAALELRYRLLPHLYTLAQGATRTALPVMRPLALHWPADEDAAREDTQYLLGEGLLVAPVLRAGHRRRLVYLPAGRWAAVFNLSQFGPIHAGGQHVVADAPLDTLPLYLRAGTALPVTEPAPHTTSARWERLSWLIHADRAGFVGQLFEDAGDGPAGGRLTRLVGERQGARLTIRRDAEGDIVSFEQRETMHVLGLGHVRSVQGAASFAYEDGVLRLTLPARWQTVTLDLDEDDEEPGEVDALPVD
ncbi:glycoside hydrolase family 31 protein [Deinococcus soli (ex Cha et al. 2016)]|uniref:Alpha-glucosidase n=2 Tax=Deinococcus soli (ex Cha et al. 2016) TaxID=1309411 RepID=A0ACC6KJE7_9DEIO|nr:glycoside hydrolase family 31 protein [Deinococcus soli (ex Cha et al. 2016)]MDR6219731.1 alpha-glucosidase [Deinococcus soli (ex Cha et al. 2016)]MDR6329669.1 alpha-glucosidase [Deinococcus soli (ex Cha et al. 2016)]MDR6752638.1 alpha-glucosidase [Deinococcus soli (ex Cha et al. 2016)]